MKSRKGIRYIIIIGVIILILLGSISRAGILEINETFSQGTTIIEDLLEDVGLKYIIGDNGAVQINIRSQTSEYIIAHNFSLINNTGGDCLILMNDDTIRQKYKSYSNTTCINSISGTSGTPYSFNCTIRYQDNIGIEHFHIGLCKGNYEDL